MRTAVQTAPLFIDTERTIRIGMLFGVAGFFIFLLWAAFAPLSSAAVAPGVVIADSRNKGIQHLEGGIIREVLVKEGARVKAGDVLLRMDSAQANANLGRLTARRWSSLAQEARLLAERDGLDGVHFPSELSGNDPSLAEIVRGQTSLFESKRKAFDSERGVLDQRIAQYEEEIHGVEAQIAAEDSQIALIQQEQNGVQELVDKGLERRPRLLALQRTAADLTGSRGEHVAAIARARQGIAEMEQQKINVAAKRMDDAVTELREVQTLLADLDEQIVAATDTAKRLDVVAPVAGTVMALHYNTQGAVVRPGEEILELVPDDDQLVIEADVKPEDIAAVTPHAEVQVRLTAYNQRRTPTLAGRVEYLSADRIVDPKSDKAHHLVRVVVDAHELAAHPDLKLYPGMPAVAYIKTGKQSLLDYLLMPAIYGLERGMREH
jgi:HlyD family type I secretion membrane fusion protein